jgi:hypothetical protein
MSILVLHNRNHSYRPSITISDYGKRVPFGFWNSISFLDSFSVFVSDRHVLVQTQIRGKGEEGEEGKGEGEGILVFYTLSPKDSDCPTSKVLYLVVSQHIDYQKLRLFRFLDIHTSWMTPNGFE